MDSDFMLFFWKWDKNQITFWDLPIFIADQATPVIDCDPTFIDNVVVYGAIKEPLQVFINGEMTTNFEYYTDNFRLIVTNIGWDICKTSDFEFKLTWITW
jgi:hypothetical protein